jgi:hypothetical protein
MLTIQLSKEPTTDTTLSEKQRNTRFDVVARQVNSKTFVCRWPWFYSQTKPRKNCKTVMINCAKHNVIWA